MTRGHDAAEPAQRLAERAAGEQRRRRIGGIEAIHALPEPRQFVRTASAIAEAAEAVRIVHQQPRSRTAREPLVDPGERRDLARRREHSVDQCERTMPRRRRTLEARDEVGSGAGHVHLLDRQPRAGGSVAQRCVRAPVEAQCVEFGLDRLQQHPGRQVAARAGQRRVGAEKCRGLQLGLAQRGRDAGPQPGRRAMHAAARGGRSEGLDHLRARLQPEIARPAEIEQRAPVDRDHGPRGRLDEGEVGR